MKTYNSKFVELCERQATRQESCVQKPFWVNLFLMKKTLFQSRQAGVQCLAPSSGQQQANGALASEA